MSMIVVQNHYFSLPGRHDEVCAVRRQANECRDALGLPPGEILVLVDGSSRVPDLVWQQTFRDVGEWRRDLEVLAGSEAFGQIRQEQRENLAGFERSAYRSLGDGRSTSDSGRRA